MKTSRIHLIILLIALLAQSCGNSSSEYDRMVSEITLFPAIQKGQGRWGLAAASGRFIIADEFESAPTVPIGGFFSVYTDNGINIYRATHEHPLLAGAEGLRYAGAFNAGVTPVCKPGRPIEIIDTAGTTKFSLSDIDGHNFTACTPMFLSGLLPVREFGTNLWGAIDTDGHIIVEPVYDVLTPFNCDHALGMRRQQDGTPILAVVDSKGSESVVAQGHFEIEQNMFAYGTIPVRDENGRWSLVDTKGRIHAMPESVRHIDMTVEDGAVITDASALSGIINQDGEVMIAPAYFRIYPLTGTILLCFENNDGLAVGLSDELPVTKLTGYSSITALPANDSYLATGKDGSISVLNEDFQVIPGIEFSKISMRLTISDLILSDRDEDHRNFNTAKPDEDYPSWMEPDDNDESENQE